MDRLIANIKKLGGNGPEIVSLLELYADFMVKNVSSLDQLWVYYGSEQWTLLHAAVIRAKLATAPLIEPAHLTETRTFFEAADIHQLNLLRPIVRAIGRVLTKKLIAQSIPIFGIPVLITAIRRMQVAPNNLTCLHANLCQLALSAKMFNPLLPFLKVELLDVDFEKKAHCIKDAILYFYYGGMIYAALKMWEHSYKFFSIACSIPTPSCSSLLLASAKKLIIVSLIHKGEFNVTEYPLVRRWKYSLDAYKRLDEAFMTPNPAALGEHIEKNSSLFAADHNLGLVKQLADLHIKCRIRNLTKIFVSLSLKDLATRAHIDLPEFAELQLLHMAASKSIFLKIDERSGCVRFLDSPERFDSPAVLASLIEKMKTTMNYDMVLRRIISEEISTTAADESGQQSSALPALSTPASKRKSSSQ